MSFLWKLQEYWNHLKVVKKVLGQWRQLIDSSGWVSEAASLSASELGVGVEEEGKG